ncbi:metallophosphoesterase [Kordiimonas lipolytica]|uniref:metallophosphoesterase n=1 Tax=Kordiimonas lipolytica TaxID=1662421 RepID=UPI001E635496|nr:metallophosphoesterase [Kordiimonas lipolytica]
MTETGRAFVVGDLHGSYDELRHELDRVDFNIQQDKLLILGDIVDRGKQCYECVGLLAEPWCYAVLGNHDEMMANSVAPRSEKAFWRANGGGWFDLLSQTKQEEVQAICDRYVERLPISMTLILADGATIGLIHADAPADWHDAMTGKQPRMEALWGRNRIRNQNCRRVANVDLVLAGHTSNRNIVKLGNVRFLDTGSGFKNGYLTVIEVGNSLEELNQNIERQIAQNEARERPDIIFELVGDYPMG